MTTTTNNTPMLDIVMSEIKHSHIVTNVGIANNIMSELRAWFNDSVALWETAEAMHIAAGHIKERAEYALGATSVGDRVAVYSSRIQTLTVRRDARVNNINSMIRVLGLPITAEWLIDEYIAVVRALKS